MAEIESVGDNVQEDQDIGPGVFSIGLPTAQARGLTVLNNRVAISVMRRGDRVVEIWANA